MFRVVDRAGFLPDRIWVEEDNAGYQPLDRAAEPRRWWQVAYANRVIVTQFDDGDTLWPTVGRRPTCSASMPSAVLGMLDVLGAQPGHRVLEIGTGTGYNAALLARYLGDEQVSTIEVDPVLYELARANLAAAGYQPTVICGDGAAGHPSSAPFDRILATATVRLGELPYAWVQQTAPGGQTLVALAPYQRATTRVMAARSPLPVLGQRRLQQPPRPLHRAPARPTPTVERSRSRLPLVATRRPTQRASVGVPHHIRAAA